MFSVFTGPLRFYDFPDNGHMAITYEHSKDLNIIRRKVYGILDFLGDIGGLAGTLNALSAATIVIFQYKVVLNYISNLLYLIKDDSDVQKNKLRFDANYEDEVKLKRIPVGFLSSLWLSF